MTKRSIIASALVCAAIVGVYFPVFSSLVRQWASDENYSHGFIILPFALFFAWQKRQALAAEPAQARRSRVRSSFACSLAIFLAGLLGAELFLTRISFIGVVAGSIWSLFGSQASPAARISHSPAVPDGSAAGHRLQPDRLSLQLLASRVGETVLTVAGVPVVREGNVLELASTKLEVAQACSGIRSLVSLLTLGVLLGKLTEPTDQHPRAPRDPRRCPWPSRPTPRAWRERASPRTGSDPEAAEGFFHMFSGWLVFVAAFGLLLLAQRVLLAI